ncbi:hypothetical protein GCM10028778_26170 [Barrientosiimonas marina]|uniref:Spore coat protein n=1 Tax=Lentibacillus kimchii TaxID=1542911 RepID=A0ABW2UUT7_9BACI
MAEDSSQQNMIPEQVVRVMIDDIFRKNNVEPEEVKKNIPSDQKQMLKSMVDDLKEQVEQFNQGEKKTNESDD